MSKRIITYLLMGNFAFITVVNASSDDQAFVELMTKPISNVSEAVHQIESIFDDADVPERLAMLAFKLRESGQYEESKKVAKDAVKRLSKQAKESLDQSRKSIVLERKAELELIVLKDKKQAGHTISEILNANPENKKAKEIKQKYRLED